MKTKDLDKHCHTLTIGGIVERTRETSWLSNPVIVKKKTGPNTRLTINFQKVNACLKDLAMPIPDIESIFDLLGGMKYKTVVDAKSGYFQVPLKESSRNITAFRGAHGFYRFRRLPQGLKTAPAIFQGIMNDIIGPLDGVCAKAYMDDVIIFSRTFEEHMKHLRLVFQRFREAGLKLSRNKSVFAMFKVPFLGRVITEEGVLPDPEKVKAITEFGKPKTTAELMRFRGMTNYHSKNILNYAKMWKPLQELMNDPGVGWNEAQERSYQEIIRAMTSTPVLAFPDWNKHFYIATDACTYAVGGVLKQKNETGGWNIIACASRLLHGAELYYPTTHQEALAIFYCIMKFEQYVAGYKFTVITDHHSLCYMSKMVSLGNRLARWTLYLQGFDFDIVYNPGKSHLDADALSRAPIGWDGSVIEKPRIADPVIKCKATQEFPCESMKQVQELKDRDWIFPRVRTQDVGTQTEVTDQVFIAVTDTDTGEAEVIPEADLTKLKERQRDPGTEAKNLIDFLANEKVPEKCYKPAKFKRRAKDFELRNGILYKKRKNTAGIGIVVPVIPPALRMTILELCHDHELSGHMGRDKTYEKVINNFFWPGISKSVTRYVEGCLTCAKNNTRRQATTGCLMPLLATTTPGYEISMDTVGELTKSATGMK